FQYNEGAAAVCDGWAPRLGQSAFNVMLDVDQKLAAQGIDFETARKGTRSLSVISVYTRALWVFLITVVLVFAMEYMRLRIPGWPLHPVMFLISGFWHARAMAASFLLGWLLKTILIKYGGIRAFHRCRPLLIGLIAGELAAATLCLLFGVVYYAVTKQQPQSYGIFPG
ncbi:MAG: hypothetical protein D6820_01885, partial [Lentisphaerae bacterium]